MLSEIVPHVKQMFENEKAIAIVDDTGEFHAPLAMAAITVELIGVSARDVLSQLFKDGHAWEGHRNIEATMPKLRQFSDFKYHKAHQWLLGLRQSYKELGPGKISPPTPSSDSSDESSKRAWRKATPSPERRTPSPSPESEASSPVAWASLISRVAAQRRAADLAEAQRRKLAERASGPPGLTRNPRNQASRQDDQSTRPRGVPSQARKASSKDHKEPECVNCLAGVQALKDCKQLLTFLNSNPAVASFVAPDTMNVAGYSALHLLAWPNGQGVPFVKEFGARLVHFAKEFDVVDRRNKANATALHLCASVGNSHMAELLIEAGADVNAQRQKTLKNGQVETLGPLDLAARGGGGATCKLLKRRGP